MEIASRVEVHVSRKDTLIVTHLFW